MRYIEDANGRVEAFNLSRKVDSSAIQIIKAEDVIPSQPVSGLPPESSLSRYQRAVIKAMRSELVRRPVATRQVLYNRLGWEKRDAVRYATPYCGFFFHSGPFRFCLVRFGFDPRKDVECRRYQVLSYIVKENTDEATAKDSYAQRMQDCAKWPSEELIEAHKFDGTSVSRTGNLYHICDITDVLIRRVLDRAPTRETCSVGAALRDGGW